MEYTCVIAVSLAARAAIDAGVPPVQALRLANVYLQKLERCPDQMHMRMLYANAMKTFPEQVRKSGGKEEEPAYVTACKDYVARHRTGRISLREMADEIHINYSYLSRRFKETEGLTIHQYIIKDKMRAAANMIRFSDLPLSEIATYLDFSSQSHMGVHFKKEYQMTPSEYRKKTIVKRSITC